MDTDMDTRHRVLNMSWPRHFSKVTMPDLSKKLILPIQGLLKYYSYLKNRRVLEFAAICMTFQSKTSLCITCGSQKMLWRNFNTKFLSKGLNTVMKMQKKIKYLLYIIILETWQHLVIKNLRKWKFKTKWKLSPLCCPLGLDSRIYVVIRILPLSEILRFFTSAKILFQSATILTLKKSLPGLIGIQSAPLGSKGPYKSNKLQYVYFIFYRDLLVAHCLTKHYFILYIDHHN